MPDISAHLLSWTMGRCKITAIRVGSYFHSMTFLVPQGGLNYSFQAALDSLPFDREWEIFQAISVLKPPVGSDSVDLPSVIPLSGRVAPALSAY